MATREQLEKALRAADAAGNEADARALAKALRDMGSSPAPSVKTAVMQPESPETASRPTAMQLLSRAGTPWQNASPLPDRPLSIKESLEESARERKGLAMLPRYGGAVLSSTGGPTGAALSGGGEGLAQLIEGESDPRALAQATTLGALPFGRIASAVKNPVARALATAGAAGGTNYATNKAADAAYGEDGTNAGAQAATVAAVTAVAPVIGRILGAITKNVSPEETARIQALLRENQNSDATLAAMKARGAAVVPSAVNPSLKNRVLESVAGIENVQAGVARENAPIFNRIARQEASLPADAAINETTLRGARQKIADTSYAEARKAGYGDQLNKWREAQTKLKEAEKELQKGFTNARGKRVDDAGDELQLAEDALKQAAGGNRDKLKAIEDARVKFAKNYDVGEATASGTDNVQAAILSQMLRQRGESGLTGGLQDIAKFNNRFGRSAKNPDKLATAPGAASAGAALVAGGGNPVTTAALTGGVPLLRGAIRDRLVSPAYQAKNAVRRYDPKTSSDPKAEAIIARLSAILAAQDEKDKK